MSGPPDDLRQVATDLRAWVRQQRESGVEWFVDLAGDRGPEPPAPAPRGAGALDVDAPDAGATQPAVPAATAAALPTAPARDDNFAAVCDAFVRDTIARLAQQRTSAPQADIFTAAASGPEPLTRGQKSAALAELAAEVAPCQHCKLASTRTQTVFGVGDPDAGLVFIGEAPGRDEDLKGEPFVGRAGQLLNDILKAIQWRREEVYICNILKCRPPENRDPEADEVEACEPYLKRQLAIIDPAVICCLGRHAAHTLLRTNASLNALRERAHFYGNVPVVVTYHPAALLRNPHWKRPTWEDVRKLRALYDTLRPTR